MMPRAFRGFLAAAFLAVAVPASAQDAQGKPLVAGENGVPVPKKTRHVQPAYPAEASAQGVRGIVIIELLIDPRGRVAETTVVRGIPGLDEAAVAAARQWEFEPVKVDGKPVSVRLTQAITFALELPRLARAAGVPELRQGVAPTFPARSEGSGKAAAEVSLDVDGRVAAARIVEGAEPWAGALLAALRTWRFSPPPEDETVSFRVQAEFLARQGSAAPRVVLEAGNAQRADLLTPTPAPAAAPAVPPPPAAESAPPAAGPAGSPQPPTSGAPSRDENADEPSPAIPPTGAPAQPGSVPDVVAPPSAPEGTPPAPVRPGPAPGRPAPPAPAPPTTTPPAPARPPVTTPALPPATPGGTAPKASAPPPVEVITAPPPELPPENGISAVRDVTLEPGVPDLTSGRRPVAPPLARMAGATGTVEVLFSVSAAGAPMLQGAKGPELLRKAAEGAVGSWVFRRMRADRAYLLAIFTFGEDKASAVVRRQPAPPPAAQGVPAVLPSEPATVAPSAPAPGEGSREPASAEEPPLVTAAPVDPGSQP